MSWWKENKVSLLSQFVQYYEPMKDVFKSTNTHWAVGKSLASGDADWVCGVSV